MGSLLGVAFVVACVVLFVAAFGPDHLFIPLSDRGYWELGKPPKEKP